MGETTTQLKLGAQSTEPGDRVTDKNEEAETTPMRVVDPDIGPANEVAVRETTVAEYEGNEPYPENDPVAEVVYESHLENRVRGWESMLGSEFAEHLGEYASEWSVTINTHKFPVSRLEKIAESAEAGNGEVSDTSEGVL